MSSYTQRKMLVVSIGMILAVAAGQVSAQVAGPVPEPLEEVGVTEYLNEQIPLDLKFRDESGEVVSLSKFFDGQRPVVLTLNYYRCPMLCGLQLNGLVDGLKTMNWTPGDEFEVVTVSFDPLETPALATEKKANYMKVLKRPAAEDGWHFLTGKQEDITALASAVGFRYVYDEVEKQYAHAAVIYVMTPDGRIARYLYGIEYPGKTLKFSLLEAAGGRTWSTIDRILLYCYHYDPAERRYSPIATNIMQVGAGATVLILGSVLGFWWVRDSRRKKKTSQRDKNS